MAIEVDLRLIVHRYAIALEGPCQIYSLYSRPRPEWARVLLIDLPDNDPAPAYTTSVLAARSVAETFRRPCRLGSLTSALGVVAR